jgi:hypothetical protein
MMNRLTQRPRVAVLGGLLGVAVAGMVPSVASADHISFPRSLSCAPQDPVAETYTCELVVEVGVQHPEEAADSPIITPGVTYADATVTRTTTHAGGAPTGTPCPGTITAELASSTNLVLNGVAWDVFEHFEEWAACWISVAVTLRAEQRGEVCIGIDPGFKEAFGLTDPCALLSPPTDSDGDGVPDALDACPSTAADQADGCAAPPPPPLDACPGAAGDQADGCPTAPPPTPLPATNQPAPADDDAEDQGRSRAEDAERHVRRFYFLLSQRRFASAWRLLSLRLRTELGPFRTWQAGFRRTVGTRVNSLDVTLLGAGRAVARVAIRTRDRDACSGRTVSQFFRARWVLSRTGDKWRMNSVTARKVGGGRVRSSRSQCAPAPRLRDDAGASDGGNNGAGDGAGGTGCHPSYRGACLDPDASDYDCRGGGNGPRYTGPVRVVGPDVFDLDANGDGFGCEDS